MENIVDPVNLDLISRILFLEKWLAGKDKSGQIVGELESMASENVFMYKNLSDNSL